MPPARREMHHFRRDLLSLEEALVAQGDLIARLVQRIEVLERRAAVETVPERRSAICATSERAGRQIVRDMILLVAADVGIDPARIAGTERCRPVAEARQAVMFEAGQRGVPDTIIGRALQRDHSTVAHGRRAEAARRGMRVADDAA